MTKDRPQSVIAVQQAPSPDLISYRFDELKGQVKDLGTKLDAKLDSFGDTFVTHETVTQLKQDADDEHKRLQKQIDNIRGNVKWWALAIAAFATATGSLIAAFRR